MSSQRNWVDPLAGDGKDRSHVLSLPFWTLYVRVAQLLIALLMLILTAFSASKLGSDAAGFGLTWFTFIFTVLYFVYLGVSLSSFPELYHPLVHLPFEILLNIFWLCSWAVLASEAASIGDLENLVGSFALSFLPSSYKSALNCVKAAAGIGALEWLLFCVSLAFLVLAFLHSTRDGSAYRNGAGAGGHGPEPAAETKPTELQHYAAAGPDPAAGAGVPLSANPTGGSYPPQQQAYPPQQQAYPPQEQAYPPQEQAYPAQQAYPVQPAQQPTA